MTARVKTEIGSVRSAYIKAVAVLIALAIASAVGNISFGG